MFKEIISAQSASVDTVSGATYSSNGIISAVQDALSKAGTSSTTSAVSSATDGSTSGASAATTTTTSTPVATAKTSTSTVTTKGKYKDGTYTGSGTGFRGGTTTLSLTVKSGKIASIQTVSTQDSQRFYDGAEGTMFNEVITAQGSVVDTVSGATYSSNGILGAVQAALAKAQ